MIKNDNNETETETKETEKMTTDEKMINLMGYSGYKDLRIDWVNNFLTVDGFASYHDIDRDTAERLIKDSRWLSMPSGK